MIDLTTYALLRKQITSAVSGVSDVRAEGDELIFVLEDGREVRVAIPATEIRDAVVRDDVLVLTLEDDKEVVVDATLTQSGQAADAKVTGDVVSQLKDDLAAITPDDTTVDGKPWTSKKIVDTICQPFDESGNPVQCYPVENYPMGVKVSWDPVQAGSGDPSPDNIRPITVRDAVSVTRCGKNLLKNKGNKTIKGIEWAFDDQGLMSVKGTIGADLSDYYFLGENGENKEAFTTHVDLVLSSNYVTNDNSCIFGARTDAGLLQNQGKFNSVSIPSGTRIYGVFMRVLNKTVDYSGIYAQLELGSTATPYEPYTGSTTDISLPKTVYGGEVDAVSGEGQETWRLMMLDGTEGWAYDPRGFFTNILSQKARNATVPLCDRYTGKKVASAEGLYTEYQYLVVGVSVCGYSTVSEWKAYLAAQYAAGTPVQVCYKTAEPIPFSATGAQPIPALSGVNTIYTDADGVVVTGAEDPKHTITELKNAIISLGGNV